MSNVAFQSSFRPSFLDDEGDTPTGYHPVPVFNPRWRRAAVATFLLSALNLVVVGVFGVDADPLFGGVGSAGDSDQSVSVTTIVCALMSIFSGAVVGLRERRTWVRVTATAVAVCGLLLLLPISNHFVNAQSSAGRLAFSDAFLGAWHALTSLALVTASQLLFGLSALLARGLSRTVIAQESRVTIVETRPLTLAMVLFASSVVVQSLSGGLLRIMDASLAIPDFPLMGGGLIPPIGPEALARVNQLRADIGLEPTTLVHVVMHIVHRVGGVFLLGSAALLALHIFNAREFDRSQVRSSVIRLCGLLVLATLAGAATLWTLLDPLALGIHMVISGLVLRQSLVLWLRLRIFL